MDIYLNLRNYYAIITYTCQEKSLLLQNRETSARREDESENSQPNRAREKTDQQ